MTEAETAPAPMAPAAQDFADAPAADSLLTRPPAGPLSIEEAEETFVVARDAWTSAMRAANSGRSADLATLAITQEVYEQAAAEVELWRNGTRIPIPIQPDPMMGIEVVVGQEIAWQRIHEIPPKRPGLIARLLGRGRPRD